MLHFNSKKMPIACQSQKCWLLILSVLAFKVKDMLDCRIEAVLQDIELTRLCDLPEDEAVTVEDFVAVTEKTCQESAESLSKWALFMWIRNTNLLTI